MKSINFEILRPKRATLADLGAFAEQYVHADPAGAAVKLRIYAEQIVQDLYQELGLQQPPGAGFNEMLNHWQLVQSVPRSVISTLHQLRILGNKSAHPGYEVTASRVLGLLEEGVRVARWLFVTYDGGTPEQCPEYKAPPPGGLAGATKSRLQAEKKALLQKLAAQEARLQSLLAMLDQARALGPLVPRSDAEREALHRAGERAAQALHFDEAETRARFVDTLLVAAGWKVAPGGESTDEVEQEVEVEEQPTPSGKGYVDYVLWDDEGKPLALIEAKQTARSPESGQKQAQLYADWLEKKHGQRPVLFLTNGYEVWFWNDHWTDKAGRRRSEPPRPVFGFHSKDSLQYLHHRRRESQPLAGFGASSAIVDRLYQQEAVKRVLERFDPVPGGTPDEAVQPRRKALLVQATGTGKTRVAVALCEALLRAGWVKRILFLCDRRELRKQAHNVFKAYLPSEPRTIITPDTARDRNHRIYLATYPAMMKCYESFDVGFFDLIIADESHRSIYNRYKPLLQYFDGYQVGLTATPRDVVHRNTYKLFDCEDKVPTAYYSYEDAIAHVPPYLVPYEAYSHTTQFLREGIKYRQLNEQQKAELDAEPDDPRSFDYERGEVDKYIFNKDTNRAILRNLMQNGIREATGSAPGKTIVFARNHDHAVLLQRLFHEMFPSYGGSFCRVVDSHDPRAESLIDDFKGQGTSSELTIAVSVDMLDTGIDVPEVVNLVFAKPLKSYVKFHQMIGRGTRLCPNLFGPGQDKQCFRIFDHWDNFDELGEKPPETDKPPPKSLLQRVFETRLELAEAAVQARDAAAFELAVRLLAEDVAALPRGAIPVREKWPAVQAVERDGAISRLEPPTVASLRQDVAPLMQWRPISRERESFELDELIVQLQLECLAPAGRLEALKRRLIERLDLLPPNLGVVQAKSGTIERVRAPGFWQPPAVGALEQVRLELRDVMKYALKLPPMRLEPRTIDVTEDRTLIRHERVHVKLEGLELLEYRRRVEGVLQRLFDQSEVLQKIRRGERVSEEDLEALTALVLSQDPTLDLRALAENDPLAKPLELVVRGIIGLDARAVEAQFAELTGKHADRLSSVQLQFLRLLQAHIGRYGSIELERLYEMPFTMLHSEGVDGVFRDEQQINDLLAILERFQQPGHLAA
jgi:type I restriction enzyme, R subunit